MNKYEKWIKRNIKTKEDAYGKCTEVTLEMNKIFPELKRVRGHFDCPMRGMSEHWWLELDGEIIDPTVRQFYGGAKIQYEPWDETQEEPTGKCGNCGNYCYGGNYCCSERCELEVKAYMDSI